ncbi:DUF2271 domain-containing protein [Pseudoalteromonas sp. SR44-5]|jgi:hypothetical protein|uniref:DUF2271 domain-containing protein n=2 Tax=Pseudoalteromonas TaxID=53246 RepID=A0ABY3FBL1_9GAMM|nr:MULTISPECIES: DUF2271 domain-containing protein [Pseudoalteromonas]MBB1292340.1 DUF2271 domain-containing protein [Pseudoalteromonas sp. SR41-4]MBB1299918.1 DUF2271 domain-containing protein [Pseudoalteromonas sp. SR44-8]MBB1309107.1 DUF2271 domain-containing protein [Pseudoalteromonas sp. SR41-8]MBB1340726.1 DUF2271 domain-containing protein [Pseudoalteromonas sp. SR45-6]MBB1365674.1 DUF2271 domain-containing protein [Pseudoalteromonas sp. SR44-5]|tara:strand:- start:2593 stop:3096 length:504 start_codon:yes stop_codon:yes gene_type:complete
MLKLNTLISAVVLFTAALFQPHANAAELEIELTLPDLDVQPYHRPYVAVWLETPERKHVTTVALWVEKAEWFKDLRQWWRKAGKSDANFDGVTGATKRPGTYTINWNGTDLDGKAVAAGKYLLNLEVVREEGGRDYTRVELDLNKDGKITIDGTNEFSQSFVTIKSQ